MAATFLFGKSQAFLGIIKPLFLGLSKCAFIQQGNSTTAMIYKPMLPKCKNFWFI